MKIFRNNKFFVLILCIISIFVAWYINNVQRIKPFFASYDPYYHYAVTTQYAESWFYSDTVFSSAHETKIMYTTLLNHTALSFVSITNVPIKEVFYYGWWILLILSFFMVIVLWNNISWRYTVWLITWCLRLVSYYVLLRHSMFLPENFALLLLIFFLLLLQKKHYTTALFILFVYGYFHYRSRYIPLWFYYLILFFDLIKTKHFKLFLLYSLWWIAVILISYPVNFEFINSMQYIIYWYLWIIPHWWEIAPNKELYNIPTLLSFINQYWLIVWNILLISFFVQLAYCIKNFKKVSSFQLTVITLFTLLLITYFSPFIAKSIPTYRFAPYILIFGVIASAFHFRSLNPWKLSILILALTLFSWFTLFYSQYWRTWITKSDASAISLVNGTYSDSITISLWAPLYALINNSEWDPEFLSRLLYIQTEIEMIALLQSRYGTSESVNIIASTNQIKARKKNPLPLYVILQKYIISRDETEYTELYRIDLSKRLD